MAKTGTYQFAGAALLTGILLLVYFANDTVMKMPRQAVAVQGCVLLQGKSYLRYAGLSDSSVANMEPAEIRDRLLKHPYVRDAYVDTRQAGTVTIRISEKKIIGRILSSGGELLLEHRGEILRLLPETKNPDLPIISGIGYDEKNLFVRRDSTKLLTAYRFIKGIGFDGSGFSREVSEIIFDDNGQMLITVTGLQACFIVDDKNIERQIAYMHSFTKNRNNYSQLCQTAKLIDVRFERKIFISGS